MTTTASADTTTTTNLEETEMATKKKKNENVFEEAPVAPPEPAPVAEVAPPPKLNKSALIRDYLERHPNVGPTELSKIIMEQNQGVTVHVSEISNIRTKMNQPKGGAKPLGKTKGGTFVANLKAFQDAVQAVGGPDEAAELLKMLN